jgi:hypothetical protein
VVNETIGKIVKIVITNFFGTVKSFIIFTFSPIKDTFIKLPPTNPIINKLIIKKFILLEKLIFKPIRYQIPIIPDKNPAKTIAIK